MTAPMTPERRAEIERTVRLGLMLIAALLVTAGAVAGGAAVGLLWWLL